MKTLYYCLIACCCFCLPAHALSYRIEAIGPADRTSRPRAINDSGLIALQSLGQFDSSLPGFPITEPERAFLFDGGSQRELIGLGGQFTTPTAINGSGVVAGFSRRGGLLNSITEPLLWIDPDAPIELAPNTRIIPRGINDANEVVGQADASRAVLITAEEGVVDLTTAIGGEGAAIDINNRGEIVGSVRPDGMGGSPFLLRGGELVDLGLVGGTAFSINDRGQAVGVAFDDGRSRAFLYDPVEGVQFLDDLPNITRAFAINDESVVVGVIEEGGTADAFVYTQEVGLRPLIDLVDPNAGWDTLFNATSINNRGQIVGTGLLNGEFRAFLLTPVPEPSGLFLVGLAAAGWGSSHRRRAQLSRAGCRPGDAPGGASDLCLSA